jgi:hypothetical protein
LRDAVRGLLARKAGERSRWRRLCGEVGVAGLLFGRPAEHAAAIAASLLDQQ